MENFYSLFKARSEELKTLLCIGLDPEMEKLPDVLKKSSEPLYEFCKEIVDSTYDSALAYKPNIAFFEKFGSKGIYQFEKLILHIHSKGRDVLTVADCKRGDLANTSKEYASYYFGELDVDSITLSPYMGADSLEPFLKHSGKLIFLLGLTSNPGSSDLQKIKSENGSYFYEEVSKFSDKLNQTYKEQVGIVVGATHPNELGMLRLKHPDLFFLIPGYGAQGGSLSEIMGTCGRNSLINSSRSIIFASPGKDFAEAARLKVLDINRQIAELWSLVG